MKLSEVYNKPLKEVIEEFDISNVEIHIDMACTVKAIEVKYTEKKLDQTPKKTSIPR